MEGGGQYNVYTMYMRSPCACVSRYCATQKSNSRRNYYSSKYCRHIINHPACVLGEHFITALYGLGVGVGFGVHSKGNSQFVNRKY